MQGEKTTESVIAALDRIYEYEYLFDVVVIIREFFCPQERPGMRDMPVDERRGMPADCPHLTGGHPYGQDVFLFFCAEAIA